MKGGAEMNRLDKILVKAYSASLMSLERNKGNVNRSLIAVMMGVLGLIPSAAFATSNVGSDITKGILTGAENVYSILRSIVLALCACVVIWAAIKAAIGDQRDMDMLKKTAITVVIVVLIAFMAPAIMKQIGQWFQSYGWVIGEDGY